MDPGPILAHSDMYKSILQACSESHSCPHCGFRSSEEPVLGCGSGGALGAGQETGKEGDRLGSRGPGKLRGGGPQECRHHV